MPNPTESSDADEESPLLLHHQRVQKVSNNGSLPVSEEPESQQHDTITRTLSSLSETWKEYNKLLDTNPLLIKCITAFFVLGLGDLCGQGVEHLRGTAAVENVDWIRAIRFGMFGLVGAPWAHYYFYYLDHFLPPTEDPFTPTTALKLLIDQGLQAPALLGLIISALAILKGDGLSGVRHDMKTSYWTALIANWKLWIPASLVNLAFVKPSLRVLYVNVVFFIWTIILSVLLNQQPVEPTEDRL